ncbi:MBL fold metallo-hydrolase [Bailinhaonella thermotolerans]|uniref:MBL fold metallo-hydrolase n=1 Tax=Bailinhaonella thermotolerans TaxID=1070861 RepID=A0A3A4ADF7_9ACTN|nr:MBL fold metallo-hydrolase [Bailinhaonella thermotolerans]RJL26471.1 MBL fold metallo-hydrolase [Bailinhaonella thermotolerans]
MTWDSAKESGRAAGWDAVGDGCFRRRYPGFDLNVGVVIGDRGALLVDTRGNLAEAAELRADLRALGVAEPFAIVNTHAHFDHHLGNSRFPHTDIWGHESVPAAIAAEDLAAAARDFPEWAAALSPGEPVRRPPTRLVGERAVIDLGDREVELRHLGRGHTAGDLVVVAGDVVFAGDLAEEGAPPAYGPDSFPLEWPATLAAVAALGPPVIVPGHGDVVDRAFAVRQADGLGEVARLIREHHAAGTPSEEALRDSGWPYPPETLRDAVRRGYAALRSPGVS